jgi:hypothetical protein
MRLLLCRRSVEGAETANELELRSAAQHDLAPERHREAAGAVAGGAAIVECRLGQGPQGREGANFWGKKRF